MRWSGPVSAHLVGTRLNGFEAITSPGIGQLGAKALEIRIQFSRATVIRVVVTAVGICLPDFDASTLDRFAIIIYKPDRKVDDSSLSLF